MDWRRMECSDTPAGYRGEEALDRGKPPAGGVGVECVGVCGRVWRRGLELTDQGLEGVGVPEPAALLAVALSDDMECDLGERGGGASVGVRVQGLVLAQGSGLNVGSGFRA